MNGTRSANVQANDKHSPPPRLAAIIVIKYPCVMAQSSSMLYVCVRYAIAVTVGVLQVYVLAKDWTRERDECPASNMRMLVAVDLFARLYTLSCDWAKTPASMVISSLAWLGWCCYELYFNACPSMASSSIVMLVFVVFWVLVGVLALFVVMGVGCCVAELAHSCWNMLQTQTPPLSLQMAPRPPSNV